MLLSSICALRVRTPRTFTAVPANPARSPVQTYNSVKVDTAMVFVDQPKQEKPPEQQPVQLDVPLKGFQTVVAPDVIPTNIPPVNLQEHFDPKDYSGTGVEGGLASGMVPTGNEVFMEA